MPKPLAPGEDDEGAARSASRLSTLLPLVRNMALIGLAGIGVIAALSTLGLDVGPLLVGLALGFGRKLWYETSSRA